MDLCRAAFVTGLAMVYLATAACSGSETLNCDTDDDCFSGESCQQGQCQTSEASSNNDTFNQSSGSQFESDTGDDNTGAEVPEGDGGGGSSGGDDNGDTDSGGDNAGNDDPYPSCSISDSEALDCSSGYLELDQGNVLDLEVNDEGEDFAGCRLGGMNSTDSFVSSDYKKRTIRACPGADTHRLRLRLSSCLDSTYPAHFTIQSKDSQCTIADHSSVKVNASSDLQCGEVGRNYFCYLETELDEGGFEWTFFPNKHNANDEWYVIADVTPPEWGSTFEYEVITHVPPYED